MLRAAADHLGDHVPPDLIVVGSGGKGVATFTPWIGFFNRLQAHSPQAGIYVVYLFAEDLQSVTLALLQGVTQISEKCGWKEARRILAERAANFRTSLGDRALQGLMPSLTLESRGKRQAGYSAGTIAAISYEVAPLPNEDALLSDLMRMLSLYRQVRRTSTGA